MFKRYFYTVMLMMMTFCSSSLINAANNDNKTHIADTTLVNKYIQFSFDDNTFMPFAIYNSLEALELAKRIKYHNGVVIISSSLLSTINCCQRVLDSEFCSFNLRCFLNHSTTLDMTLFDSLGYYYMKEGDYYKALSWFKKAEELVNYEYSKELIIKEHQQGHENPFKEKYRKSVSYGFAVCYKRIGNNYFAKQDFEICLEYQNKALSIFKTLGNKLGIASCYNNIGITYLNVGNNFLALDNLLKSLKINEGIDNNNGLANCILNVAIIYLKEKNYSKSLEYVQNGFKVYNKIHDKVGILNCYNTLGNIYSNQGNYIKALEIYDKALKISGELKDENNIAKVLNNIGDAYMQMANYPKALEYFNEGLKINKKTEDKVTQQYIFVNLANTYFKLKKYNESIEYTLKALKLTDEIKNFIIANLGYKLLKEIFNIKGDKTNALIYADLYKSTGDSLFNSEKSKKIFEIQSRYESEKKEFKITKLEQEKQIQNLNYKNLKEKKRNQVIIFSVIIICLFLSILLILVFYNRFKLKQKNLIERELSLQRELRYHEVIDAQEKERKRIAEDLHDSLGQMLSTIKLHMESVEYNPKFDSSENHMVLKNTIGYIDDACSEVRNISHHLMPEALITSGLIPAITDMVDKINKTNKLKINFSSNGMDKRMNESAEINIYRMMQELIGNVIKHSHATQMNINISRESEHILLTIVDNGKGLDQTKIKETTGIGWKNIYSRLAILDGKIDISTEINKETRISINFTI